MKQKKEKKILKTDIEQYMPYIDSMLKNNNTSIAAIMSPSRTSKRFKILPLKKYKGGYCNFNSWIDTGQASYSLKAAIQNIFSRAHAGVGGWYQNLQCVIDLHNDKVYYNGTHSIDISHLIKDSKVNVRQEKLRNTIITI